MLETLTCADFVPHLHTRFFLAVDDATTFPMELVEAAESRFNPGVEGRRQPFSTVFLGPGDVVLPQGIYRLTHPEMGALDLFLVPIGVDASGVRYEAVFT